MNRRARRRSGFTLIEVLLVLAILVVLGSLAVGVFTGAQKKADIDATRTQVSLFESPISMYHLSVKRYPSSLDELLVPPNNLPPNASWDGPYLKGNQLPVDAWGNPYQYAVPGTRNPQEYDVWSLGPDGVDGSDDDIGNWYGVGDSRLGAGGGTGFLVCGLWSVDLGINFICQKETVTHNQSAKANLAIP